ncbi:MAG: glycosyltransferase, partial [Patescibacteria group bacterium]
MRIAFTGGGTGGHFFPILAVAREIKRMAEEERILDLQLFYFGPQPFDPGLMQKEDILFVPIAAGKIRRYFSLWNITDIFKTALGILQAMANMFVVMPDVVFAKGGYGSFPTLLAARIYRVPVIIHESDARPGRVNRWAGKWAIRIAIAFEGAAEYFPQERTALTGTPIRKRILGGSQEEARESLGVFSDRPVIFIIGGSQGARVINETITQILPQLLEHYEIIHQVGDKNIEDLKLETASILEDTHIARREPG